MDIERTMEFILDQQAKFAAGLDEMRHRQAEFQRQQAEFQRQQAESQRQQAETQNQLAEMQRRADAEHARLRNLIAQLADQVIILARHAGEFEDRVNNSLIALSEAQRHTEEKLNALIAVVDGIQRGRTGQ